MEVISQILFCSYQSSMKFHDGNHELYVLINFNFTEYDLSTSIMSLGLKKNNQHESINRCNTCIACGNFIAPTSFYKLLSGLNTNVSLYTNLGTTGSSDILDNKLNVRENRRGNQKLTIQRKRNIEHTTNKAKNTTRIP